MSSIPARMKKIQLKMKALDCSQDFLHYKSMRIFPDAQGHLTPQSLVRSGRILNSSEILWMSSLPASMKKIRSKMKALEWTQHFPHYNSMVAMETSGRIWPNFDLIQALIHVLITCKMKRFRSKIAEKMKHFPHYNPMGAICCHGNQSSKPTWSKT